MVARTREQVRSRLNSEINHWDARHAELLDQEAAGRSLKIRPDTAYKRARDLRRGWSGVWPSWTPTPG